MGVLDSSIEAPGCTDNNTKNLNSLWCTVAKQIQKKQYWPLFFLNGNFWGLFLIFSATVHHKELRFFAL